MLLVSLIAITLILIATLVMGLASLLSKKDTTDREKSSPFECGFDPNCSSRLPFSLRFFLIAVIFLIFDVEIALLLPLVLLLNFAALFPWFLTTSAFLIILLAGLYHEWHQGALNWAN
uniref:NADH-ubiquinone oxidoreductase chain 3 n=1 Tax=Ephemerella sp. Yunnan-2018 TaxID=2748056 RepID=A0A7D6FJ51_9INSE|nr:NADH dehydrogenase subunit 3 [Ephemerella sp. Yunnan-2018]QLP88962.1 NADH dehydrogenase subunit 3 [Ephemerella sp. Yunnan-2018]